MTQGHPLAADKHNYYDELFNKICLANKSDSIDDIFLDRVTLSIMLG